MLEEVLARDAVALGQPHQAALVADQALVDVVELLDQRIDARLVEPQRLHLGDDLFLELLVLALLRRRQRLVVELELDVLVLQAAQPLVGVGDVVEGLQHLGLELGLDRGERQRVLDVVVVEVGLGGCGFLAAFLAVAVGGAGLERRRAMRRGGRRRWRRRRGMRRRTASRPQARPAAHRRPAPARRHRLGVGARIGRFEIDDVAQEDLALVELVAPDDDGLEGERALAQARDHRLAAGLDALGDGDFALAREQLHRAHLAQIHAHRIVGALGRLLGLGLGRDFLLDLDELAGFALGLLLGLLAGLLVVFARFLGLDDVDAHLAEHRQHVLDLLGIDLLGGQHRVDLFVGDVAALLGALDHLLDRGVGQVEQRQRPIRGVRGILVGGRFAGSWRGLGLAVYGFDRNRLGGRHALARHVCLHERRRHAGQAGRPQDRPMNHKGQHPRHRPNQGAECPRTPVKPRLTLSLAAKGPLIPSPPARPASVRYAVGLQCPYPML